MKQNKFKIITPSYNNESWVEFNIASILNQRYLDYEVLYINDASTDSTYDKVKDIIGDNPKFNIVNRIENRGAMYNYSQELEDFLADDDSIIIHLDGDDWFYDESALSNLNDFYNQHDCWMTYGGFIVWNGFDQDPTLPYPQSTEFSDFTHKHNLYRQDHWRASHLRTYRSFLYKAINKDDFKSRLDDKLYWHAADLAMQFPCLEMCPAEKIKLIDFFACVYNHSQVNQHRTHERESSDNAKYEAEIRNKKKYKQGLSGTTLPQVNVIGDFRERNSIPKDFSYVYNLLDGEFDVTLIQDMDILRYINGNLPITQGKIVADIHEAPHLLTQHKVYDAVKTNSDMFDLILTFDEELLKLPNAKFRNGGYEVVLNKSVHKQEYPTLQDDSLIQVYEEKPKHVSFITSNKTITEGHRFRLSCAQKIHGLNIPNVDLFGVGIREIVGKIEGLQHYKFSVAIENGVYKNYFTEKILDCFLTGVVPIYRGCDNIGEFFDTRGMYIFNTEDELITILSNLTSEDYYSKMEFININFTKAKSYSYDNDIMFNKFIKDLI